MTRDDAKDAGPSCSAGHPRPAVRTSPPTCACWSPRQTVAARTSWAHLADPTPTPRGLHAALLVPHRHGSPPRTTPLPSGVAPRARTGTGPRSVPVLALFRAGHEG